MSTNATPAASREPRPGCEWFEEVKGEAPVEVGRDPRAMTPEELKALGHAPMPPLGATRLRCLDRCCGSAQEVRLCPAVGCPNWSYRLGPNPHRRKSGARLNKGRAADREQPAPATARTGAGDGDAQVGPASAPPTRRGGSDRNGARRR
jgi:hypothetical protein